MVKIFVDDADMLLVYTIQNGHYWDTHEESFVAWLFNLESSADERIIKVLKIIANNVTPMVEWTEDYS